MIKVNSIRDIKVDSKEGQMLIAAIALLTSIDTDDIESKKWGGGTNPDGALQQIVELTNKIYHEEEWKLEQRRIEREKKIGEVLEKNKKNENNIPE